MRNMENEKQEEIKMAIKKQPCGTGGTAINDYGYRSISAAVIKLAVEDLKRAHKKLLRLENLATRGKLKSYIQQNKKNPQNFRFTPDENSAISFFKQEQGAGASRRNGVSLYPLYAEMINFSLPAEVKRMMVALCARKSEIERTVKREQDKIELGE